MNATLTPPAQIQPDVGGDGFGFIGIHTGSPMTNAMKPLMQAEGILPLILLVRVMQLALSIDEVKRLGSVGTMEDGMIVVQSKQPLADVEIILGELRRVYLEHFCQVAVLTSSEWECVHPGRHVRMSYLLDMERFALYNQKFIQAARERLAALAELKKRQQPPPPENPSQGEGKQ